MPFVSNSFKIEHISCSSYCTFERCPFLYYLRNLECYTKPEEYKIALDYGKTMHRCLPLCYDGDASKAISLFNELWSQTTYGFDDKVRNPLVASLALRNFVSCRNPSIRPYDIFKMPFTSPNNPKDPVSEYEVTFAVDTGGVLPFVGRIDAPIVLRNDKTRWPMDYKTSREVSSRLCDDLATSPQAIGYTLATSHLLNEDCKGCCFELLRSSDKNQEVLFWPVYVKSFQLTEFMESLNRQSERILECNDKKNWPRKRTGCGSYSMFGVPSYVCPFKNLCSSDDWVESLRYFVKQERFDLFESISED